MTKKKVAVYWRICWSIITPTLLIVIFIYFLITTSRLKYGEHDYPDSALGNKIMLLCTGLPDCVSNK